MPLFAYEGFDKTGAKEAGSVEAGSEQLAFDILGARGITLYSLSEGGGQHGPELPWYRRDISFRGGMLAASEQANVAELLATLFDARLPILEITRVAAISSSRKEIGRVFERIGARVADGEPFPSAFRAEGTMFSPIFSSFLEASDIANARSEMLQELSYYFRKQDETWQKVTLALIYPGVLIIAALMLLLLVVFYLAPNLEPIFTSSNVTPPRTISVLVWLNSFLRDSWIWILTSLAVFGFAILAASQSPVVIRFFSRAVHRFPTIGPTLFLARLSRLCHASAILLQSGLPAAEALRVSSLTIGKGAHLGKLFDDAATALETGQRASDVFEAENQMPPSFLELFRIGETTNTLPTVLSALSETTAKEVERRSQRLLTLLTPTITLVMGAGIGALIYTIMGAILEVSEIAF